MTDQLGTPRIIFDQTGSLASVSRHDYLPFGEELFAGTGGRTPAQGYTSSDNVRQKFTSYHRDVESGLDYAKARYYANAQGRFTSIDPLLGSATVIDPASWNRYTYVRNNPLKYIDPSGLIWLEAKDGSGYMWVDDKEYIADDFKEKWNEVLTGTVIPLGGVSGSYDKYRNLVGGWVALGENGVLEPAAEPAEVTIRASDDDQRRLETLTQEIGGVVESGNIVRNTTATSYNSALNGLHTRGFRDFWNPMPDHWGGSDHEGQIEGNWYHITLRYPDRFNVNCDPAGSGNCSRSRDMDAPWTGLDFHYHTREPHNHWQDYVPWRWLF